MPSEEQLEAAWTAFGRSTAKNTEGEEAGSTGSLLGDISFEPERFQSLKAEADQRRASPSWLHSDGLMAGERVRLQGRSRDYHFASQLLEASPRQRDRFLTIRPRQACTDPLMASLERARAREIQTDPLSTLHFSCSVKLVARAPKETDASAWL